MLHFDLNVSILLREYPFLERFDQAARLEFEAVEFWWPSGEDLQAVVQRVRDAHLRVELFNFDAGDMAGGDRGLLNDPERQSQFRANVPVALELADRLNCRKLNLLLGKWRSDEDREAQLERVRQNVLWAAEQAESSGVTLLVEALNVWENGPYILTNTRDAIAFIDSLDAPNVQFQYDVYHMQRMEGNVVANIYEFHDRIGHIQVADSPRRHQPGTGELNYPFIFSAIVSSGYRGAIGLEYIPRGSSEESLYWLPRDRTGPVAIDELQFS